MVGDMIQFGFGRRWASMVSRFGTVYWSMRNQFEGLEIQYFVASDMHMQKNRILLQCLYIALNMRLLIHVNTMLNDRVQRQ